MDLFLGLPNLIQTGGSENTSQQVFEPPSPIEDKSIETSPPIQEISQLPIQSDLQVNESTRSSSLIPNNIEPPRSEESPRNDPFQISTLMKTIIASTALLTADAALWYFRDSIFSSSVDFMTEDLTPSSSRGNSIEREKDFSLDTSKEISSGSEVDLSPEQRAAQVLFFKEKPFLTCLNESIPTNSFFSTNLLPTPSMIKEAPQFQQNSVCLANETLSSTLDQTQYLLSKNL